MTKKPKYDIHPGDEVGFTTTADGYRNTVVLLIDHFEGDKYYARGATIDLSQGWEITSHLALSTIPAVPGWYLAEDPPYSASTETGPRYIVYKLDAKGQWHYLSGMRLVPEHNDAEVLRYAKLTRLIEQE